MAIDWTREEIEEIVDDYMDMLSSELRGKGYNKSEHRRRLSLKLNTRSDGSIEFKHQNISAILIEMGLPYIDGYKPMRNYQKFVFPDIVMSKFNKNNELLQTIETDVKIVPDVPSIEDILTVLVAPPESEHNLYEPKIREGFTLRSTSQEHSTDYIAKEAANNRLGLMGEEFVINYERARLIHGGRKKLADKIDHVSASKGDRAGFDIHSYEDNGTDRFIEVKTTKYGKETPFYITSNELEFSASYKERYHLYRVFSFRKNPRLFTLQGSVGSHCKLRPLQFMASF